MNTAEFNNVMDRIGSLWPDAGVIQSAAEQGEWFKALSRFPTAQVEEAVSTHYREPGKNLEGKKPALPSLVRIIRSWRKDAKPLTAGPIGGPSLIDQLREAKVTPVEYARSIIDRAEQLCPGDAGYAVGAYAEAYRIIRDTTGMESYETQDAFAAWQGKRRDAGMEWMDWDTHRRICTDRKFLKKRMEHRRAIAGVMEPVKRISSDVFIPMKNERVEAEREANAAREELRKERDGFLLEAHP